MSTHEDTEVDGAQPRGTPLAADDVAPVVTDDRIPDGQRTAPSWWHRSHPVFTPVAGFFTGLLTLVVVPSIYGAVLGKLFGNGTAQRLFPYVLVIFAVPLVLTAVPRTRRFGLFMLIGMLATAVVVAAAAGLTLWYLLSHDG